ncbi:conserved hypothetical protein [Altererythrobacter sp. B11]|uniref:EF-hand domain-containing protein n=1 Tax=Altererythrobacter sp. B11 TaxID=2060312 RepID=UPI000DC6E06B|nr:hypothetical protein [Altererythrobacter sp. B11]BBC71178.1 conserved hypothetical protein [Altererythrobacter sp. B11]
MRKTITLSLAAAALLASGATYAATGGPGLRGPGKDITRDQVQQMATKAFARMDANGDGKLDQADRTERQQARFDKLDGDGNGAVTFAEYSAAQQKMRDAVSQRGGKDGADRPDRKRRFGHRGAGMMRGQADANGDGTITAAEFQTAALTRFDAMDTDRNGTVTSQERRAAFPRKDGTGQRTSTR